MLIVIIIRSVTLPGAAEGLKFMFVPGYALEAGFIKEAPSLLSVVATAGGQMFFSLSLAMGIMVTYGSYLGKGENLVKNSAVVVICDTLVALMAGLAVIPAAVATYGTNAQLSGPKLLFITLQDVFSAMGTVGPLFGTIFYLLVFIAAISSAISLTEVMTTFFMDQAAAKGKVGNRSKISIVVCLVILAEAILVAVDGLGSNGVWVPGQQMFGIRMWNDCWLDFMDCWSEGIAMPMGAMLMALLVGWELKPKFVLDELAIGGPKNHSLLNTFFTVAIKFIAPLGMMLVFAGQIYDFFVDPAATDDVKARTQMIAYCISGAVLVLGFLLAKLGNKENKAD
jgi:NSS family neurotransmitter:Na+ symporter